MTPLHTRIFGPYPRDDAGNILVPTQDVDDINRKMIADAKTITEQGELIKQLEQALDTARPPMHWWCDADPETGGDTPLEALEFLNEGFAIEWEPQQLHATFAGPTKWAVLVPASSSYPAEAHLFNTEDQATTFRDVTRKARAS